ncbi:hypothetical protein K445DRAFT_315551 [Daldinia sp. EC12]|nr:hypothetical protein K445DRAFT_315551 [Daldinia sp. EC12]
MRILNRITARATTIPAACYSTCNNAVVEAQSVGKGPSLCAANSDFIKYRDSCKTCIESNRGNWSEISSGELSPWITYCDTQETITTATPSSKPNSSPSSSTSYDVVTRTYPYTTVNGGVTTTWVFSTVFTKFAPIPATTVVMITTAVDGEATTLSFTTTYLQITDDRTISVGNLTSTRNPISSATDISPLPTFSTDPAKPASRAWIAGPVVGAFSVVSIVGISAWLLWRRRRKRLEALSKTELHGDSAVKTELDAPNRPQELDAINSQKKNEATIPKEPQELQAN